MSVRRATQCLGKLPDKSSTSRSGCSSHPASPFWPGRLSIPSSPLRWHDERESSKLLQAPSPRSSPSVASERLFRSRETVQAWLESSPTSVLDDLQHLDGDLSAHSSSLESFNSSPSGSPFHRSVTSSRFFSPCPSVPRQSGFLSPCSATHQPGHVRVRAISPPRCPAGNKNPTDVSRIDAAAQGSYFLSLISMKAQNDEKSNPHAFQSDAEQCDSPRSEFSLTSEWQNMLAAGNAAGMSTRHCNSSSGNYYETGENTPYESVSNGSDTSAMLRAHSAHAEVMRRPEPCRVRSMELPQAPRVHDHNLPPRHSAPQQYERRRTVHYDMSDVSGPRIPERARSIKGAFEQRMGHRATSPSKQAEVREVKRVGLLEKMQNDIATAFRKTPDSESKKAIAEAKRAEKAARAAATTTEPKLTRRRSIRIPRGCLFLG